MTPELTVDNPLEPPKTAPSTAGMTTKVVKGSMWTLVGSVAPLAVSFISTPFVIRFLGTESYGLLLLVGLIPTYLMFADFGMGVASTKFASEAFGRGDEKKEAEIVWAATARSLHICPPSRSFVSFRVAPFVSFKTKSMTYGRLISA